jgi:hypothetical protein
MKYAHLIDTDNAAMVPPIFNEPHIAKVLKKLNYATMSPEEKAILDMAILKAKMSKAIVEEDLE